VTRKEIERSGATSINELLHSIPSIDIFDQGELASNSPAGSGTASIRMRGLSESNVLVLLNGRRLPVNALYDSSGAGAAFDINSLPIGAIDRIEILKDGGSAIYGADAVAGVVNFITKTDYQGIEATASYGNSSRNDGKEKRLGLSAGFGDLTKDRYNVLFGLDVFKRDPILRADRDISKSEPYPMRCEPEAVSVIPTRCEPELRAWVDHFPHGDRHGRDPSTNSFPTPGLPGCDCGGAFSCSRHG